MKGDKCGVKVVLRDLMFSFLIIGFKIYEPVIGEQACCWTDMFEFIIYVLVNN